LLGHFPLTRLGFLGGLGVAIVEGAIGISTYIHFTYGKEH
jgi:hypothetical protein